MKQRINTEKPIELPPTQEIYDIRVAIMYILYSREHLPLWLVAKHHDIQNTNYAKLYQEVYGKPENKLT